MRAPLALACLLALLVAAPAAAARPAAPTGLHGFLLRADESRHATFPRTPAFAWNPVRGAHRYEFQLSTSSLFRESGLVYASRVATTPATAVPVALPWTSGSPHSLYARVRAVGAGWVTPWSRPYGFSLRWGSLPVPVETSPGLLRWTPVEGATGYTVWYLFPDGTSKQFTVHTNVADQREWYTFHQDATYSGEVRWRVRAVRRVYGERANGLPAVSYGPWSPVYTTRNPAVGSGPTTLLGSVSDAASTPQSAEAHRLMPAFAFSGNASLYGRTAELHRVYVFTDRDCVNAVFRGAIVGSPAYAPRPFGPLALPATEAGIAAARRAFLPDGKEPPSSTHDLEPVEPTEQQPSAAPFSPTPASGQATAGSAAPAATAGVGAPVDLWDTDWPRGRYWWTVVPVVPVPAGAGTVEYRDLELAQEACAAGRVLAFGKASEPVVTAAAAPYASGLSPRGRLVSAVSPASSFYGHPVVAWAPALGASAYEVQWSRTRYPFRAAAPSLTTASTAAMLPLRPGTWHYRVRGINLSAPTAAQPMSWSDPVRLRIARPTFRVVGERGR